MPRWAGTICGEERVEAVVATLLFTFDVVGLFVLWRYDRPEIES